MYRIVACPLPEQERVPERDLAPVKHGVQAQRARVPAQDRGALARNPGVVVCGGAAARRAVEEQLGVRGERDVDDGRLGGRALQTRAKARAELPGRVGGEVREDTTLLLGRDSLQLQAM